MVERFSMSQQSWRNYYGPLADRVAELEGEMPDSPALKGIKREVDIGQRFAHECGYHMFVMQLDVSGK